MAFPVLWRNALVQEPNFNLWISNLPNLRWYVDWIAQSSEASSCSTWDDNNWSSKWRSWGGRNDLRTLIHVRSNNLCWLRCCWWTHGWSIWVERVRRQSNGWISWNWNDWGWKCWRWYVWRWHWRWAAIRVSESRNRELLVAIQYSKSGNLSTHDNPTAVAWATAPIWVPEACKLMFGGDWNIVN